MSGVHPIEAESYRILGERVDLSSWAPGPAALAARVVHATADPGLVAHLVVDDRAVAAGVEALRRGAPVVCDVEMVRSGLTGVTAECDLREVADAGSHPSRTAAAMARALARHPEGAVVVVGCAPTALFEVCRQVADGALRPALVVGVPVGFVGAAESKEELVALAARTGVPSVVLGGERGGAAVAAAVVNALVRLARDGDGGSGRAQDAVAPTSAPACLLIGHGSRSEAGEAELRRFVESVSAARPAVTTGAGYIEFVEPGLDESVDRLVAAGAHRVIGVPLVLLGAGHLKDDGPAALARGRRRHPGVGFAYARDLGVHPDVLAVVAERAAAAARRLPGGVADALVVVGRGSSDPDANADLAKAARLLADGRALTAPAGAGGADGAGGAGAAGANAGAGGAGGVAGRHGEGGNRTPPPPLGLVVPAFVSLARPGVADALDHCARLGARRVAVVPYFLFTGLLVDRIGEQVARWGAAHRRVTVAVGDHMGVDRRLVDLAWHRYDEAAGGPVHMNCDGCLYRAPLPGYEHRVGAPPFGGQDAE